MTPTLVISAVNFTEGGPLTVLRDCAAAARCTLPHWRIIVMVNSVETIAIQGVEVMAFPWTKTSWLKRLLLEWKGFYELSKALSPDIWLSLHDITPRVQARQQAVYCHNPAPFYRISCREALLEPKFLLFNFFYGVLYRILIQRNSCVVVQQGWLREEFIKRFAPRNVVVAHPSCHQTPSMGSLRRSSPTIFFYPSLPRVFKNFEVLCEAAKILSQRGIEDFEIRITLSGTENRYARWLKARYEIVKSVRFIGRQDSHQMKQQYQSACAVVFASRLETWGLPITEAQTYGLPLLVADEPYARETVGNYDMVSFFPARNSEFLADLMQKIISRNWLPEGNIGVTPIEPFAADWSDLFRLLTDGLDLPLINTPQ